MQEKTINQQYKELNEKILDKVFGMALDGHEAGTFPKEPYLDVSSGHYGKWQALKLVVRHNQCQVAIYFDHRIRISVLMHKKAEFRNQAWYSLIAKLRLFVHQDADADSMVEIDRDLALIMAHH